MPLIKALTVMPPYSLLMCSGVKTIETRPRRTHYRGPLAIHSGLQMMMPDDLEFQASLSKLGLIKHTRKRREHCCWCWTDIPGEEPPVCTHEYSWFRSTFPRGRMLGVCELYDCIPVQQATPEMEKERIFGDWSPGRWLWLTSNFKPFDKPFPCRGYQGLWNWEMPA